MRDILNGRVTSEEKGRYWSLVHDSGLEQLTSLIANQLELAMCDGDLTGREMDFIRAEVNAWGYPVEEYRALRNFLLLKNQSPILFA